MAWNGLTECPALVKIRIPYITGYLAAYQAGFTVSDLQHLGQIALVPRGLLQLGPLVLEPELAYLRPDPQNSFFAELLRRITGTVFVRLEQF